MKYRRTKRIEDWSDEKMEDLRIAYIYNSTRKLCIKYDLSDNQIRTIARANGWKKDTSKSLRSKETEKLCSKCKETLPVSEYNRRNSGYQSACRSCSKATTEIRIQNFNPIIHTRKYLKQ